LGGRKIIRPVKKLGWWGTGMVIGLEQDADLYMAQLMPLPLTLSLQKNPDWFYLSGTGSLWVVPEKGPLNG